GAATCKDGLSTTDNFCIRRVHQAGFIDFYNFTRCPHCLYPFHLCKVFCLRKRQEAHDVVDYQVNDSPYDRAVEKPFPPWRQVIVELANAVVTVIQKDRFFFLNRSSARKLLRYPMPE